MDNKIEEYGNLFNDFIEWKDKMKSLFADEDFKKQREVLMDDEDNEWYGMVYDDISTLLKDQLD